MVVPVILRKENPMPLILTRMVGEQIEIGDDIVLSVVAIRANREIKIVIEAPKGINIRRRELNPAIVKKHIRKQPLIVEWVKTDKEDDPETT